MCPVEPLYFSDEKSITVTGFLLGFFSGGGAAKNFLWGAPSKFSGANDSRGGKIFLRKIKFSHRVEISISNIILQLRHIVKYTESTKRCLSLLLPILEKLSKFSQNYKFREVFSKRGSSFFRGGHKILNLQGQNLFRGASRFRGRPPAPLWKKARLRNDKYIMMQYTNWINSTPSQQ